MTAVRNEVSVYPQLTPEPLSDKKLALFKKRRGPQPGRYQILRDSDGKIEGLWLSSREQADDPAAVGAILADHGVHREVADSAYRVIPNTVTDHGGVFVRFVGEGEADTAGVVETLRYDGRSYPLHEDFDAFCQDAAAGRIALWKTTLAAMSLDDMSRLFAVLEETFGYNAPEARAVMSSTFYCRSCMHGFPAKVLVLRDKIRNGARFGFVTSDAASVEQTMRVAEMTECIYCGGLDAVWAFDPSPPQ